MKTKNKFDTEDKQLAYKSALAPLNCLNIICQLIHSTKQVFLIFFIFLTIFATVEIEHPRAIFQFPNLDQIDLETYLTKGIH